jgi:hypothetical protein
MAFPREYLDFATWYLRSKKHITKEDNSDFALTVSGVDFVEENYARIPLLKKMLRAGSDPQYRNQSAEEASVALARPKRKPALILPMSSEASDVRSSADDVASTA